MNLLTHDPPTELEVDGVFYPIDWDYKNCLQIIMKFEEPELTTQEKMWLMLEWLYCYYNEDGELIENIPPNIEEAVNAAVDFLNCGDGIEVAKTGRLYSFSQDDKLIRSAIEKSRQIRLSQESLHWWEFCYSFLDIDEDTLFSRVMGVRLRRKKGKPTKEDKEFIKQNPRLINLELEKKEQKMSIEEKMDILSKLGGDVSG